MLRLLSLARRLLGSLGLLLPLAVGAQLDTPIRTHHPWRTLETPNFAFHHPAELEAWTRQQAVRMEGVREAVRRLVGYAPPDRVDVLVEDPTNQSNGSAYPFRRSPALFLWPVPPDPRSVIGDFRDWGELLLVHEYAHLAHLTRPSRNPWRRRLARLSTASLGPIPTRTPRWVWEGYATYVEGRLTGSGRPHGVWRPAILRQWALEGRLPSYAQLNGGSGPYAGSMAYLAGSAYFEWLVTRHAGARGDSVLPHLWRRLTARTSRDFASAFAGVFPGSPSELYGRWTAEVTAEAVAAERRLREAGLVEGRLVQRLPGLAGDPAVSPDGRRIAFVARPTGAPPRVVVLHADSTVPDSVRARAVARALARDPEDVAAVPYLPNPLRQIATLPPVNGRGFDVPRFLPDGDGVLLVRREPQPGGVFRPDLWRWSIRTGALRRLTHGASVDEPDPAPDGRTALGTRCARGTCDVVRVDLATGAVATVLAGDPNVVWRRPRWAPDGRRFVAVAHRGGRWRPAVANADGSDPRPIGPDDGADRYDASFVDGARLVVVSERGGVPNLELITVASGDARPLTRVTGAAVAPAPIPGRDALVFLSLRSGGYELRRLALPGADAPPLPVVPLTTGAVDTTGLTGPGALAVVERPAVRAPAPATTPVASRPYGVGPRHHVLLPVGSATADGESAVGALSSTDPAGRLSWLLQGAVGDATTWRGGQLAVASRRFRPTIEAQLFAAAQRAALPTGGDVSDVLPRPANAPTAVPAAGPLRDALDVRYHGALLALGERLAFSGGSVRWRAGLTAGRLAPREDEAGARTLGVAELRGALVRGRGERLVTLAVGAQGAAGRTFGREVRRAVGSASLAVQAPPGALRLAYLRGMVGRDAPAFERFLVGGGESPLVDASVLSQRLAMPALPTGALGGRQIEIARVDVGRALLTPYAWAARAPDGTGRWLRVLGAESSLSTAGVPFARLPGARVVGGVGYPLDEPRRRRLRGYVTVTLRP